MVMPTAEDRIRDEAFVERIDAVMEAMIEIHQHYAPLVRAVDEVLKEANSNNEPWKCPKFKALAEELEKIEPKEIEKKSAGR